MVLIQLKRRGSINLVWVTECSSYNCIGENRLCQTDSIRNNSLTSFVWVIQVLLWSFIASVIIVIVTTIQLHVHIMSLHTQKQSIASTSSVIATWILGIDPRHSLPYPSTIYLQKKYFIAESWLEVIEHSMDCVVLGRPAWMTTSY